MKNVLMITIDAFGADKCWNLEKAQMEFLNKYAENGVKFTNLFSSTSSTTPSLASIQTGLYPKEHGIISTYGHELFDSVHTLAEVFKNNGYSTYASVGGPLNVSTRLDRGFDKFWYHKPEASVKIIRWTVSKKRTKFNNYLMAKEAKKVFTSSGPWFYWMHLLDVHNRWRNKSKIKDPGLADYEKAILDLDKKIEHILSAVDLDETILIFSADHGHYVAEIDVNIPGIDYSEAHGFGTQDVITNVPLLIVNTNLASNHVSDKVIATVDIMPTVIEMMGFKNTYTGHGKSFLPLLKKDESDFEERPVFLAANGAILRRQGAAFLYGYRKDGWKLVRSQEKNKLKSKLYDLKNDRHELKDVYEENKDKAELLEKELEEMIMKVQDGSSI